MENLYIPHIPSIKRINDKLNVALLQNDIVVIDILNNAGKRHYLRLGLDVLYSLRASIIKRKLKTQTEQWVSMDHAWLISLGEADNYGYQIHFESNLKALGFESMESSNFILKSNELFSILRLIKKMKMKNYVLGYYIPSLNPNIIVMFAFYIIFRYYYHNIMKNYCMKCIDSSFVFHDINCIHEQDSVVNNVIARNTAKLICISKLKVSALNIAHMYNLPRDYLLNFDFEAFLSKRGIDDFNRAIRFDNSLK